MNDKEYLKICLSEIALKLNWDKPSSWKDKDYIKLAEIISDASNISISAHTLKRLFGKIKYVKSYNPQQATKDALAIFIGFNNWDDFIENQRSLKDEKLENPIRLKSNNSATKYSLLFIVAVGALILFYTKIFIPNSNITSTDFQFDIKDSIGVTPFTIAINYDVSNIKADSIILDYNFINPMRGPRIVKLNELKHINNFTYQIPGYYSVSLKADNKIINTKKILAISKGWDSYIMPENDSQTYWINREIQLHTENGFLYYSPERIKSSGFNNTVFYVVNRLFREFEIDGDNFEMKVKFKNTEAIGGITCYNFNLKLFCTNETNNFSLMENGCSQFSRLKIGDNLKDGMNNNMASFKINTQDWNIFYVIVDNKKAKIYINNELIFEGSYNAPNGKIVGIENMFKGCGMLDYIKIKDLKTEQVFFDDFSTNTNK